MRNKFFSEEQNFFCSLAVYPFCGVGDINRISFFC